jgi:hypothetical protein
MDHLPNESGRQAGQLSHVEDKPADLVMATKRPYSLLMLLC